MNTTFLPTMGLILKYVSFATMALGFVFYGLVFAQIIPQELMQTGTSIFILGVFLLVGAVAISKFTEGAKGRW